jgi:hypothetical protein
MISTFSVFHNNHGVLAFSGSPIDLARALLSDLMNEEICLVNAVIIKAIKDVVVLKLIYNGT